MNRNTVIFKNVSLGILYKILNMSLVYITLPVLLQYLEVEEYGVWVTIFSIISIVFFVDGGIGNGLKTKLTEALSSNNVVLARKYISTAYIFIFIISLILLIIGVFAINFIDLKKLLSANLNEYELKKVFLATLLMIIISFILSLYKSLYYAIQQTAKVELSLLIYQAIILFCVFLALHYSQRSLLLVALIYGGSNIIVGIIFTVLFFNNRQNIIPSFKFYSRKKANDLMSLSIGFFFIQLCMIVIFTTDNVIISKLLGPSEVTKYDIVYKLFQVIVILSVIVQNPFWPLYTEAFKNKDFNWIRKTLLKLNKLFIPFVLLVMLFVFISKPLIKIWIGKELDIPKNLILFMGVFVIIRVYGIIYMNFLNGIGKIKLQLGLYIIGAVINIPLSVFFVKYMNLGSPGVILATIISIISMTIILPIQSFKILKKSEYS